MTAHWGALAALALAGGGVSPPDLVARGLSVDAGSVAPGGRLDTSVRIRNVGGARVGRSRVRFFLSRDRRRDAEDRVLARRRVPALDPDAAVRRAPRLRIPGTTAPGGYRLLACADAGRRVGESREGNNCRSVALRVTGRAGADTSPPQFAGLQSATTCIPGPSGGEADPVAYELRWNAASDNRTAQAELVYDVYRAAESGGQDFSMPPAWSTPAGATSFTTPKLAGGSSWYFVVRARDGARNRDGNRVEQRGENLCR